MVVVEIVFKKLFRMLDLNEDCEHNNQSKESTMNSCARFKHQQSNNNQRAAITSPTFIILPSLSQVFE